MHKYNFKYWAVILLFITALASCKEDENPEPQPTTVVLTTQAATLDGNAITPVPDYKLTLNFDKDGNPNGYSSSGSATIKPSIGTSGTFSISGNMVTFTSGGESRSVTVAQGTIGSGTTTADLQWELTKIDDGVTPEEEGTYVYQMAK